MSARAESLPAEPFVDLAFIDVDEVNYVRCRELLVRRCAPAGSVLLAVVDGSPSRGGRFLFGFRASGAGA